MSDPGLELPRRLKAETRELHAAAERSGVMALMLQDRLPVAGYVALLQALRTVYQSLEDGLQRHAAHPLLAPLRLPGLARTAAIEADLAALCAAGQVTDRDVPALAGRYAQALRELADGPRAWLLGAHAYVRYLGDLHGGQILRERARRLLGAHGDAALNFYDFGDPPRVERLIGEFRSGLAAIGRLDPRAIDALVREAQDGFAWHVRLFAEIGLDIESHQPRLTTSPLEARQ
jgi:heme oxygenase